MGSRASKRSGPGDGSRAVGRPSLVVVYHRAPLAEAAAGLDAPNGIIPTLRGIFGDGRAGAWVAWTIVADDRAAPDPPLVHHGAGLTVRSVPLPAATVVAFYHRFSKEALWPILCSAPDNVRFEEPEWENYVAVNVRFADAVARLAAPDATVWVHDYNLWLVPGLLRARLPRARIGFFHHTPFPAADIFAILPWREAIVDSLLECDVVGFHLPHYANNFASAAESVLGARVTRRIAANSRFTAVGSALAAPRMATELALGARRVALAALPAGLDSSRIDALRATAAHAERVRAIRDELYGQQVVLSVDRLDYVKGSVEKLLAYERLLETCREHRGAISFVCIVAPAAGATSVHRAVRRETDALVGRINGRFATLSWTPVRYFHQPLSFERVVSWYDAASIAWIAPLRDGLNLVAKEFVAASGGDAKVLVLSEFAGAHVELKHAVTVNPYSPGSMDEALRTALAMPDPERRLRMRRMDRIVRTHGARRWASDFLALLEPDAARALGTVMQTPRAKPASARRRAPSGSS